jgi:lysozyme
VNKIPLKLTLPALGLTIFVLGLLLYLRVIWFVYPDKNIYQVDGLDVSNHQGVIDWKNVDARYKFVFVKATEAVTFVDKSFLENAEGVKRTGRMLGAYHFFHLNYDGAEQAENFINTVGDVVDLPPVIDFEFTGNPKTFGKSETELVSELRKCINKLEEHYKCKIIIYTTRDAYDFVIKDNIDNPLWYRSIYIALNKDMPNVLFWQYHNSARVNGIDTPVDLNVFRGSIEELSDLVMKIGVNL